MQVFMAALMECSVTMSVLILAFILATPWLSRKYSAKWLYYIWLVLVIGLIIPFRVHPDTALIQIEADPDYIRQIMPGYGDNAVEVAISDNIPTQVLSVILWRQTGLCLWIGGFLTFVAYHWSKHSRFLKIVKRWSEQPGEEMNDIFREIKSDMEITKPVKLQICPCISSPMLIGFLKPVILLPGYDFSMDELSYILKHELIHLRRKDLWYKRLVFIATAIHWFNPVVYAMAKAIASQCEISCDAEVVKKADIGTRQRYSEIIIGIIKNQSRTQTAFSTNFYGGEKGMKKRIFSIMDTSQKKAAIVVLCLVLAATLGTGVVASATSLPPVHESYATYVLSSGEDP